jgi:formylglycine-generating enzyme required for sulfatase activity
MADIHKAIASNAPELRFRFGRADWSLVRIPPGSFSMGSPLDEPGREDVEMPPRRVHISKPFYLGRYQITQVQYTAVTGHSPARFSGPNLAVDQIKFSGAHKFCRDLSKQLGLAITLPTEAQWEYAYRAGTQAPYYSGSREADAERIGWYRENSGGKVHEAGQKAPNAFGLYDMAGNLYEPCLDAILNFDAIDATDPVGTIDPNSGVARGGAWMEPASRARAAFRVGTNDRFGWLGIRIAIVP